MSMWGACGNCQLNTASGRQMAVWATVRPAAARGSRSVLFWFMEAADSTEGGIVTAGGSLKDAQGCWQRQSNTDKGSGAKMPCWAGAGREWRRVSERAQGRQHCLATDSRPTPSLSTDSGQAAAEQLVVGGGGGGSRWAGAPSGE
jgi:hypothetical protein